jgi:cell division protein FtsW
MLTAVANFFRFGRGDADADRRTGERRAQGRPAGTGRRRTPAYKPSLLRSLTRDALDTGVQGFDAGLLWCVAILLMLGLVMVYSASIAVLERRKPAADASTYYLVRHSISMCIAIGASVIAFAVPVRHWQRAALPLFLLGIVLLALVFVPGIGRRAGGADRWISLGVMSLQPSELMKLFVILYVADYATRKQEMMHQFKRGFIPMAAALAVVGILIMREPDLGALMVIVSVAMGVLFLGGMSPKLFFGMGTTLAGVFMMFILFVPFRRQRFFAYLEPFAAKNAEGSSYQLTHSLMAIGRGNGSGSGLAAALPSSTTCRSPTPTSSSPSSARSWAWPGCWSSSACSPGSYVAASRSAGRRSRSSSSSMAWWRRASGCGSASRHSSTSASTSGCCRPRG